jgi:type II secretory pathway pseudopilin PulG
MCVEPTTALMIASVASAGIQYQATNAQQKAQQQAQNRQNELARQNAIQRYAAEGLKIRQITSQTSAKGLEASKKTRSAQAQYVTQAGDAGGLMLSGSTDALMRDFYRVDGNYKNSLTQNLKLNESQFRRNLEAIQFGQESQSTYVTAPNPELNFATQVLNVANTYYGLEAEKANRGLQTNREKNRNRSEVEGFNIG